MEQKFISFEDTQKAVDAQGSAKAVDLCDAYKKVRPILLFAMQFLPKKWKELVEDFMKFLDAQCHVS